jgi:hypothetical protein
LIDFELRFGPEFELELFPDFVFEACYLASPFFLDFCIPELLLEALAVDQ